MYLLRAVLPALAVLSGLSQCTAVNRTYNNPILPGWNSDPSCTFVKEWNNTFFCTTSSFLAFPGIPVFASKDLTNWRHISNALTRPEQLSELYSNGRQIEGIWASTIRYRDGVFYLITSYVSWPWGPKILLFTSDNPFDDTAWKGPIRVQNPGNDIDPDLFWDDDGKVYMSEAAGIYVSEINLATGSVTQSFKVWNGTGDRNPEGPHFYRKDGYYYLLIGEGGTESNHSATIARSRDIRGPYEGYPGNPLLTAKNTPAYFQTVGHADLFQDASGNWWAVALATRSGPAWEVYPMGRETVLVPATWKTGEWPVLDPVRGRMSGPLPPFNRDVPGDGQFVDDPDVVDFEPNSSFPKHFAFWRPPKESLFAISPEGHPNTLRISPSRVNLTGDTAFSPKDDGLAFIARKQTATIFDFSVDVSFQPVRAGEEAGISVFLTQFQHIDLSIINDPSDSGDHTVPKLRFRVEASGKDNTTVPQENIVSIPRCWLKRPVRLSVSSTQDAKYVFSAAVAERPATSITMGSADAGIVSGGSGPFTGTIIGTYVSSNNGNGTGPAYFSRWRYTPLAQEIAEGEFVPVQR